MTRIFFLKQGLSLGVDESWQGVLDIIQGVMNESEEQRTIEETVILASLKNLPTDAQVMRAFKMCR